MNKGGIKVVAQNKRVWYDYFVDYVIEAGIQLFGTEVKSIRQGKVNLKDSYVSIKNGEVILYGMHISPYEKGNIYNRDPIRTRKLLMHKREINKLVGMIKQKGMAVVPTKAYIKGRFVKIEVGICKGKKLYDKRQSIAEKSDKREMERRLKERVRDMC